MNYNTVIKNAKVVLDGGAAMVDIGIRDGKIVALEENLEGAGETIDAEGLIIFPGMIDPHTHIADPGRANWETYEHGTRSAAKGGVTTLLEMPLNQLPVTANREALDIKIEAGQGRTLVDIALYGALIPSSLDDIQSMSDGGIVGYKAFMSTVGDMNIADDMRRADDYTLYEGMKRIAKTGKPLLLHCENDELTDKMAEIYKKKGPDNLFNYVESRPVFTEVEAIRRAIYLAKQTDVRLYICHISCPEGVAEVKKAKEEGVDIYAESCTHYFAFTQEGLDDIGNTAKCSPPIRNRASQDLLFEQLINGDIDTIGSDHSPCTSEMKQGNAFSAWGGISGLQNSYDVLFDEAVQKRGMSLERFAEVTAGNAADIFGLDNKGRIALGKDADLVFIKPNSSYVLREDDLEYKNKISPYVDREIGAQVVKTILRGRVIYDIDEGVSKEFYGRHVLKK